MRKKHSLPTNIIMAIGMLLLLAACMENREKFVAENLEIATAQTRLMLKAMGEPTGKNYPRTMDAQGGVIATDLHDRTSGYFAGTLWQLYDLTGDASWREEAEKWTRTLEPLKNHSETHALGYMMRVSYGNAWRLAPKDEYKDIIVQGAETLAARYDERLKVFKSSDTFRAWDGETIVDFPMLIDNMTSLELLFMASRLTGNNKYRDMAVNHANATILTHLRDNYSTYQVVGLDTLTGEPTFRGTAQGYSNNSTWARGQAWTIYGFTVMYRETQDPEYLRIAMNTAKYYLRNLPEDLIPIWDFNVREIGQRPDNYSYAAEYSEKLRDASSACIVSSAFFELGTLAKEPKYIDYAISTLKRLCTPGYRAKVGHNANFIIKHSVGSIPHRSEIDKPAVYADYFFLEALSRYKNLELNAKK